MVGGEYQQGVTVVVREIGRQPGVDMGNQLGGVTFTRKIEHPVRERQRLGVQATRDIGLLRLHPLHGTGATA
ncbi:hypothetical protein GCM10009608_29110 [Pseudonocardia alaniniphila]